MGEGMANEKQLLPFIEAANIACGYHAGDEQTMRTTLQGCLEYNILAGAHPSFNDRENFGRKEIELPPAAIYDLVTDQLSKLDLIMRGLGGKLHHVKPHGALYNMSARNIELARVIAKAVKEFDPNLKLFGLRNSCSVKAAEELGLTALHEVFADRGYRDDGSLIPRSEPGALIHEPGEMIEQLLRMKDQPNTDTVCIHGDGPDALAFAKLIHQTLGKNQ